MCNGPLAQMGFSPTKATVYIEMFEAINAGVLAAQKPRSTENSRPTLFERFCAGCFCARGSRKGTNRLNSKSVTRCVRAVAKKGTYPKSHIKSDYSHRRTFGVNYAGTTIPSL